jgi:hypothetical protein
MTVTAEYFNVDESRRVLASPRGRSMSTPRRLRLYAAGCAGVALLVGLFGGVAVSSRHAAAAAAWKTAEPLMVDAQAIDTSLSDADTTEAGSFLEGQVQPVALQTRYLDDITEASSTLATTAQTVGVDPAAAASLRRISVALPMYTGLIQTAAFNQRQANYPLAAAYMGEANNLMRSEILPAAATVYGAERARLAGEQQNSLDVWLVILTAVLFVVLIAALILLQRWMSGLFRRTFTPAMVGATIIMAVLGAWFAVAVVAQSLDVHTATSDGSGPVATFTQARIRALEMRADDELTLLSRDSVSSYQSDYTAAYADLHRLLGPGSAGASATERARVAAATDLARYRVDHDRIRHTDTGGNLIGAVAEASAPGAADLPSVSLHLDQSLSGAIATSQRSFDGSMAGATTDIGGLLWAIALLPLLAAALVIIGVRPRMAEYR